MYMETLIILPNNCDKTWNTEILVKIHKKTPIDIYIWSVVSLQVSYISWIVQQELMPMAIIAMNLPFGKNRVICAFKNCWEIMVNIYKKKMGLYEDIIAKIKKITLRRYRILVYWFSLNQLISLLPNTKDCITFNYRSCVNYPNALWSFDVNITLFLYQPIVIPDRYHGAKHFEEQFILTIELKEKCLKFIFCLSPIT